MLESDKEECAIDESTLILGDSCGAIDYECDNKDDDAETDMLKNITFANLMKIVISMLTKIKS